MVAPTMGTDERLEQLRTDLQQQGADKIRLEAVRRARNFKRSWVEMAEILTKVRNGNAYLEWGYADFHQYCQTELILTKPTVDKLTASFSVVREHAPYVLARDGIAQPIPSIDAVEYFAKAVRESDDERSPRPAEESMEELRDAVFRDPRPVAVLRKTFDPVFFPKTEDEETKDHIERARAAIRRTENVLQKLDGVDDLKVQGALRALRELRESLEIPREQKQAS